MLTTVDRKWYTTAMEKQEALKKLADVVAAKRSIEVDEVDSVAQARGSGATWNEIAETYGISRQAAHFRWAQREKDGWE